LQAAYKCTTLAFQERQPFADFERALQDSKVLGQPLRLRLQGGGQDAQGRRVSEMRFDGLPFNLPPLLKTACRSDDTGWWIDDIEWVPRATELALAHLQAEQDRKKEAETRKKNEWQGSPKGVADHFVELLQSGDVAGAYALTTKQYQVQVPRAQFETATMNSPPLRDKVKLGVYFGGSGQTIKYNVRPANLPPQTSTFVVHVLQENGKWRVQQIDWGKP
jgi:hypothetical protein